MKTANGHIRERRHKPFWGSLVKEGGEEDRRYAAADLFAAVVATLAVAMLVVPSRGATRGATRTPSPRIKTPDSPQPARASAPIPSDLRRADAENWDSQRHRLTEDPPVGALLEEFRSR